MLLAGREPIREIHNIMMETLKQFFGERFKEGEPLKNHTTFKIGGPAKYFVMVKTAEEIKMAIAAAKGENIPYAIIGGGSNLLVSDSGYDGLVIKISGGEVKFGTNEAVVDAGYGLIRLILECAKHNLSGLEFCIGIPGTIGGAIFGNAGAEGRAVGELVKSVELLMPDGVIQTVPAEWMQFSYRESKVKNMDAKERPIIIRATFALTPTDGAAAEATLKQKMKERLEREPKAPSAGCFFKNIKFTDAEREHIFDKLQVPEDRRAKYAERNSVPVAWLIEDLGFKGKQIGGAKVAEEHANFIVNTGNATADEVMQLVSFIKMRARDHREFQLEDEVQLLGF